MYEQIINKLKSELITSDKNTKKRISKALTRLRQRDDINNVLSELGVYDLDSLNNLSFSIKNNLPEDIPVKEIIKKEKKKREFTIIKMEKSKEMVTIK